MPPHSGHRSGGVSGTSASSSQKRIGRGRMHRRPDAMAPIVPRLTPVIAQSCDGSVFPRPAVARLVPQDAVRSWAVLLAQKRARRRKKTSSAVGLLWIPVLPGSSDTRSISNPTTTAGPISRQIFGPNIHNITIRRFLACLQSRDHWSGEGKGEGRVPLALPVFIRSDILYCLLTTYNIPPTIN